MVVRSGGSASPRPVGPDSRAEVEELQACVTNREERSERGETLRCSGEAPCDVWARCGSLESSDQLRSVVLHDPFQIQARARVRRATCEAAAQPGAARDSRRWVGHDVWPRCRWCRRGRPATLTPEASRRAGVSSSCQLLRFTGAGRATSRAPSAIGCARRAVRSPACRTPGATSTAAAATRRAGPPARR